tara:strand:+ start:2283 stop:2660 length:378 start_codon:yes stop_codon:yes gene_type:complete
MRKLFLFLLLYWLFIVGSSFNVAKSEELTVKQEKKMMWFQVLTVADALQTIKIAKIPGLIEGNPIMGANPSVGTVVAFFTVRNIIHHQVVKRVPQKYKDAFIDIPLVGQGIAVVWNLGNGLGIGF